MSSIAQPFDAHAEAVEVATAAGSPPIRPGGYWKLAWRRFRRDKFALGGLIFVILLFLLVYLGEPILERLLGHGPNDIFPNGSESSLKPVGPWTHVPDTTNSAETTTKTTLLVLGGDSSLGRDEFLRLLKGGQSSLEVGLGSSLIALVVGVPLGALAGLLGGWTDALVSRLTEFFMGFPVLLLLIALGWSIRGRIEGITFHGLFEPGVVALAVIIGMFSWFYPARIVRAEVLRIRSATYIEAARMVGAGPVRIVRSHVLPHLVGPIAVYGPIIVATNIVLESALSFLNLGIPLPVATWGNMLSTNWGHFFIIEQPGHTEVGAITSFWTTFWPATAILVTVLAFALVGEGIREAFEPGSRAR